MKTHELKIWPEFFEALRSGLKTFVVNLGFALDFRVGDRVTFREFEPCEMCGGTGSICAHKDQGHDDSCFQCICLPPHGHYTSKELTATISFWLSGDRFGFPRGYCVFAVWVDQ